MKAKQKNISSINPANGQVVFEIPSTTTIDIDRAISSAKEVQKSWAKTPFSQKQKHLSSFQEILKENQEVIARTISEEMGKPLWDSKAEVVAAINKIPISLEAFEKRCPDLTREKPSFTHTTYKPHGVVAVFGPFNFPLHLPNGHIIPALIAGNAVVFKPSELTPKTADLYKNLFDKTNMPKDLLQLVYGGKEEGKILALHEGVNGIFFTGSYRVGKWLSEETCKDPRKILALEMGGNNALVVGKIEDLKSASQLIAQSAFITSGQRCTCARRLILIRSKTADELLRCLVEVTKNIRIGAFDSNPEPFMGPVVSEMAASDLLKKQDTLLEKGAFSIIKMALKNNSKTLLSPGLLDCSKMGSYDDEIFGPLLQIRIVENLEQAIEEANNTQYGLSAGILSDDEYEWQTFKENVNAGIINRNTVLPGASSYMPFGGIGKSGNYRPSAYFAADYCSYPVASMEESKLKPPKQLPPGLI